MSTALSNDIKLLTPFKPFPTGLTPLTSKIIWRLDKVKHCRDDCRLHSRKGVNIL